jgi:hypothetical protein
MKSIFEGAKTGIIKSGVNLNYFPSLSHKQKSYNAVWVGRLAPEKNLNRLIELFTKLDSNKFKLTTHLTQ